MQNLLLRAEDAICRIIFRARSGADKKAKADPGRIGFTFCMLRRIYSVFTSIE